MTTQKRKKLFKYNKDGSGKILFNRLLLISSLGCITFLNINYQLTSDFILKLMLIVSIASTGLVGVALIFDFFFTPTHIEIQPEQLLKLTIKGYKDEKGYKAVTRPDLVPFEHRHLVTIWLPASIEEWKGKVFLFPGVTSVEEEAEYIAKYINRKR